MYPIMSFGKIHNKDGRSQLIFEYNSCIYTENEL